MSDELAAAVERIDAAVPDARAGLPDEVFYLASRLTPLVNVDLLIRDADNRVLMTWRADRFYGPGWHIPGGIIRFKEKWEDRIAAVAAAELGATISCPADPMTVKQPIHPTRATRGHFISLLFDCRLTAGPDESRRADLKCPGHGEWAWIKGCPDDLLPVHKVMYADLLAAVAKGER